MGQSSSSLTPEMAAKIETEVKALIGKKRVLFSSSLVGASSLVQLHSPIVPAPCSRQWYRCLLQDLLPLLHPGQEVLEGARCLGQGRRRRVGRA